mmetsp:Transcript_60631/g.146524  ORF Transcript_60631/g.146524 Transcript_60631/m.146524 type:complete len:863 (+) Transcript_60631:254-2842(+)
MTDRSTRGMSTSSDHPDHPLLGAAGGRSGYIHSDVPKRVCRKALSVLGIQKESPVAWSPDGEQLAFVSGNHSIYIASVVEGRYRVAKMLDGHVKPVRVMVWHPSDANTLVSAGPEGIYVWDVAKGETIHRKECDGIEGRHTDSVEVLCFATGGLNLVSGSKDTNIKIWATEPDSDKGGETYRLLETIEAHKSTVLAVQFNENTATLATAGRDSSIKLWDGSTLTPEFRAKRKDDSGVVCALKQNIDGHRGDVTCLTWSVDGATLYSGARDNTMKVWDAATGMEKRLLHDRANGHEGKHRGDVRRILLTRDGQHVITAGLDAKVKTWRLAPEEDVIAPVLDMEAMEREREATEANILAQILGTTGLNTVEGSGGAVIGLGDDGPCDTLLATFMAFEEDGVHAMEANPMRPILATTSVTSGLRIWNMADATRIGFFQEFVGHTEAVHAAEIMGEGDEWLFTCSDDYNVHLYNLTTFERPQAFNFESSAVCLALRPATAERRGYVFVGGADYVIKAYPLDSNETRPVLDACNEVMPPRRPLPYEYVSARFEGHSGRIMTIALNPEGNLMATGAHDFNIYLWKLDAALPPLAGNRMPHDVPRFSPAAKVDAHRGHVHGLKFNFASASQLLLASCGSDHSVKVWKPTSGVLGGVGLNLQWTAESPEAGGHTGVVSALTWGKGGSGDVLFSAGWDHTIKVWQSSAGRPGTPVSPIETLRGHTARITDLDSSNDGAFVVSVAADFTAVIWGAGESFSALAMCKFHSSGGILSSVSVGREAFVAATGKGQIEVWPLPTAAHADEFEEVEAKELVKQVSAPVLPVVLPGIGAGGAGGGPAEVMGGPPGMGGGGGGGALPTLPGPAVAGPAP